jgi:hypothetical protein
LPHLFDSLLIFPIAKSWVHGEIDLSKFNGAGATLLSICEVAGPKRSSPSCLPKGVRVHLVPMNTARRVFSASVGSRLELTSSVMSGAIQFSS